MESVLGGGTHLPWMIFVRSFPSCSKYGPTSRDTRVVSFACLSQLLALHRIRSFQVLRPSRTLLSWMSWLSCVLCLSAGAFRVFLLSKAFVQPRRPSGDHVLLQQWTAYHPRSALSGSLSLSWTATTESVRLFPFLFSGSLRCFCHVQDARS